MVKLAGKGDFGMKWVIAYVAAGVSFGALDALWLGWAGKNLYRPALGELLAPSFRPAPAIVFYLLYIAALVWFAVRAGHEGGIGTAVLNGERTRVPRPAPSVVGPYWHLRAASHRLGRC